MTGKRTMLWDEYKCKRRKLFTAAVVCFGFLVFSCAASPDAYNDIDSAVNKNEFETGIETIKKSQNRKKPVYSEKNAVSLFLDKGLLEHYAGNYRNSSADLQEAERLIEEAFTKSITADIFSYIINDNTKEYPGEDFEDIYINVFNALNYFNNNDIEGALVEIRKLTMPGGKLDMLERKYENTDPNVTKETSAQLAKTGFTATVELPQGKPVNFSNSALARYLSALFYLGAGKEDEALIELEYLGTAFNGNPRIYTYPFPSSIADIQTIPDGKVRLNIISFTGLSPIKREGLFYQYFPFFRMIALQRPVFKLPVLVQRTDTIDRIEIIIGENKISLELLEDMGAVIEETYNARFSKTFLKTYIRTLLKYAAIDIAASEAARGADSALLGEASALAAKKLFDSTERADIRMSRYLPNKAYIGGIYLDPGEYTVIIHYYSGGTYFAKEEHRYVNVKANTLNLIETICLQ